MESTAWWISALWKGFTFLVFWIALIYGLAESGSGTFEDTPSWQSRGIWAIVFIVCVVILGRVIRLI